MQWTVVLTVKDVKRVYICFPWREESREGQLVWLSTSELEVISEQNEAGPVKML